MYQLSKIKEIIESKKHYDGKTLVERMKECRTPAISIALVEDCKISEVYTHGVKQRAKKDKVTAETLFQAASISKPVFAFAVMRLVERGVLDIDKDISEYLTDYEVPTYDNQKHKITLRQMLSHNAGLNLHGFFGYQQGQEIPTITQILNGEPPANHLKLKLAKKPETGHQYSGGGYVLAQKIVTDMCKQTFVELMDELVLSPCAMSHSTFASPLPKDKLNTIAFGYDSFNLQSPGGYIVLPEAAAASLWTTPTDLALFGIEVIKALKSESEVLTKDTAELMTKPAFENSKHGIGFFVDENKNGMTFGHGGDNIGYHANMCFCPKTETGMVVMQNADIGRNLREEVTNAFKEVYGW